MRLILIGCEYSGTTTLANAINDWSLDVLGHRMLVHDHWKIPHISGHPPHETKVTLLTEDEKRQVLEASSRVKELLMRYALYYHTPSCPQEGSAIMVGYHIEDMIYGPLYFGYGREGEPGDRRAVSHHIEHRLLRAAPETALILVSASPEVIARRMRESPHDPGVVPEKDIGYVLERFQEEYEQSQIRRKFTLDTSTTTVKEALAEFVEKVEPYLSDTDRIGLAACRPMV